MKVTLRKKKLARSRESLYLDIYHHGKRSYEFLELYFEPGQTRDERDEVRRIAERIRSRRQIELSAENLGEVSLLKAKADFLEYLERRAEKINHWQLLDLPKASQGVFGESVQTPFFQS